MTVSNQKFPLLQYTDFQPLLIYCHKLW